jgi:hypothetical protein
MAPGGIWQTMQQFFGHRKTDQLLFFVHIPKTAGTSLVTAMQAHFAPDRICPRDQTEALARLDPADLRRKYDFIPAHTGMDVAERIATDLVTVVREPTDRILSLYNYWRSVPSESAVIYESGKVDPAVSLAKSLSFRDFVLSDHPRILHDINNGQTFQIASSNNAAGRRALTGQSDDQVLQIAQKNLGRMRAVGRTENLEVFRQQMMERLEMKLDIPFHNKTQKRFVDREQLDPKAQARLQELNELDYALYEFVKATYG